MRERNYCRGESTEEDNGTDQSTSAETLEELKFGTELTKGQLSQVKQMLR